MCRLILLGDLVGRIRSLSGAVSKGFFIPRLLDKIGFDTIGGFLYTLTHHRYVYISLNFTAV